jgi:lactate permease
MIKLIDRHGGINGFMNSLGLTFLGFIPLIWLFVSLGWFKISAIKASLAGLALAGIIAIFFYKFSPVHTVEAAGEGVILAIWPILWAVVGAIFSYNVGVETGNIDKIKMMLAGLSTDRRVQVLILAWAFSGFLEGATGYGTAVAIPAGILVALGFEPIFAAMICLLGNTAPTAFGAIGIPLITLSRLTGYGIPVLSKNVAWQLTPLIIIIPLIMVWLTAKKGEGLKGVFGIALVAGLSFALVHYWTACFIGPELPSMLGGVASLIAIILWLRFQKGRVDASQDVLKVRPAEGLIAWSPYILLFVLISMTSSLFPGINSFFSKIHNEWLIYRGPGGKSMIVYWILTPGTFIFLAALLGGLIQGATWRQLMSIFMKTVRQLSKTMITICAFVAMSEIMSYSGMNGKIAITLSMAAGKLYPLISPAIGALGTFLTGSDTSANILFGQLQKQTALHLGINPQWIAAANDSGATAGKLLSPQNITIAAAVTGLTGSEGKIFHKTIKYCLIYIIILGLIVMFFH